MVISALQEFDVYKEASKIRDNTSAHIKYFRLIFDSDGRANFIHSSVEEDGFPILSQEKELDDDETQQNALNICVKHNTKWYIKVSQLIIENQKLESEFPHGSKIKNKLRYLSDVKMHYRNWFESKRLPIPTTNIQINPDFNPRNDYSELILDGDFFEVRNQKVRGFITFLFDEYDADECFNGTEAVKEYYSINHLRGQVNFSKLFKDASDTYIQLKDKLFIPKAIRSREYRIKPIYLISS